MHLNDPPPTSSIFVQTGAGDVFFAASSSSSGFSFLPLLLLLQENPDCFKGSRIVGSETPNGEVDMNKSICKKIDG